MRRSSPKAKPRKRAPKVRWLPTDIKNLSPSQKVTYEVLIGELKNNYVGGPFPILLSVPGVAEGALRALRAYRHEGKLDRRLYELAVLVVAREWRSSFEWHTHEPRAIAAGLTPDIVAKIRAGKPPRFKNADERMVYKVSCELVRSRKLSQRSYEAAVALFGTDRLVELVTIVGFYTMLAMTLVTFAEDPADWRAKA